MENERIIPRETNDNPVEDMMEDVLARVPGLEGALKGAKQAMEARIARLQEQGTGDDEAVLEQVVKEAEDLVRGDHIRKMWGDAPGRAV